MTDPKGPTSPWGEPCAVCKDPGVEVLCGACRAPIHGRCAKRHYDTGCPLPNFRHPDGPREDQRDSLADDPPLEVDEETSP